MTEVERISYAADCIRASVRDVICRYSGASLREIELREAMSMWMFSDYASREIAIVNRLLETK
jgi:hypothetical protein